MEFSFTSPALYFILQTAWWVMASIFINSLRKTTWSPRIPCDCAMTEYAGDLSHIERNSCAVSPEMLVNKIRLREAFCLRIGAGTSFQIVCSLGKEPGVFLIRPGATGKEDSALHLKRQGTFCRPWGALWQVSPSLTWGSPLWSKQRSLNQEKAERS